ncbi:MAG: D-lyxose/D-mannose family sugar isomerase [Spirochaetota bacterium]
MTAERREMNDLIRNSGIHVSDGELESLLLVDYGLANFREEGVGLIDIVHTDALRLKILALLPGQTLPEHVHPPYEGFVGKEETLRVIHGLIRVYLPGPDTLAEGFIPEGKEPYYTCREEHILRPIEQITIPPGVDHWFQAGDEGLVAYAFYPQAVESHNRFRDPRVPREIAPGY